jgi:hypothetical protein
MTPTSQKTSRWSTWVDHARRAQWLWRPVLAFVVTRLGILGVAYFSAPIVADSNVPPYHLFPDNTLLDVFASRWDTGFYLSIAETGYRYEGERLPSVAFFPLLPILMRGVGAVVGDLAVAGLIVANVSLLGAAVVFYRLVDQAWGGAVAERAVWYWLVFPTSFFGSAIYTESLFLLAAILALYLARRGWWVGAGLAGLLAALSRLMGLIVFPLLVVEWLSQRRGPREGRRPAWLQLACTALVPLGTGAYLLYLQLAAGDALAFMRASAAWGREPVSPLALVADLARRPAEGWLGALAAGRLPLDNLVDLAFVVVFVVLGIGLLARRRWSEGVFVLMGCLLPLSSGLLMSQRRYVWVLFPAFILLAQWGARSWFDRLVLVLSILGLGLFTVLFTNWYWVG